MSGKIMKAATWRTGDLRIKYKTLARSLIHPVTAKEVKTNNMKFFSCEAGKETSL